MRFLTIWNAIHICLRNPGYPSHRKAMYHKFLLGKYVGLYQVDETEKCVTIARIFHGSQNYQKYL